MSEPTPRPWYVCGGHRARNIGIAQRETPKYIVYEMADATCHTECAEPIPAPSDEEQFENARLIVRAVNTYDEREALIRELVAALNSLRDEVSGGISSESGVEELKPMIHHEAVVKADAALAKAREVMGGG